MLIFLINFSDDEIYLFVTKGEQIFENASTSVEKYF